MCVTFGLFSRNIISQVYSVSTRTVVKKMTHNIWLEIVDRTQGLLFTVTLKVPSSSDIARHILCVDFNLQIASCSVTSRMSASQTLNSWNKPWFCWKPTTAPPSQTLQKICKNLQLLRGKKTPHTNDAAPLTKLKILTNKNVFSMGKPDFCVQVNQSLT